MDTPHRTPQHPSYRKHRRQLAWQIIVPVIIAALLLVGATYFIVTATFQHNGDAARWAEISTMWLTIPFMIGALVVLAIVIAMAYLLGKVAGFIPPYTFQAQLFAARMAEGAHRVEQVGHKPLLIFPAIGRLIRAGFRKIRSR